DRHHKVTVKLRRGAGLANTHRALCVTGDPHRRRALRRTLQAVGSAVDFSDAAGVIAWAGPKPDLLVLDRDARRDLDVQRLGEQFGEDTKIVVLGESLDDASTVALLRQHSLDHLIADADDPDDAELVIK